MSKVLKYETSTGYGKEYIESANTPDYEAPVPPYSFLVNPDVSAVAAVPVKYWKVVAGAVVEMSSAEKTAIDDAEAEARAIRDFPVYTYQKHNILTCDNADWPSNGAATVNGDPSNLAVPVMVFSNGSEKGVGFAFVVPSGIKKILVYVWHRAASAPGSGKTIKFRLYSRDILDGGAISAWRSNNLDDIAASNDVYYHCAKLGKKTDALGVTEGVLTQFELTRRGANDTLGVDCLVTRITVKFK